MLAQFSCILAHCAAVRKKVCCTRTPLPLFIPGSAPAFKDKMLKSRLYMYISHKFLMYLHTKKKRYNFAPLKVQSDVTLAAPL